MFAADTQRSSTIYTQDTNQQDRCLKFQLLSALRVESTAAATTLQREDGVKRTSVEVLLLLPQVARVTMLAAFKETSVEATTLRAQA